jgi:hypothetical protein
LSAAALLSTSFSATTALAQLDVGIGGEAEASAEASEEEAAAEASASEEPSSEEPAPAAPPEEASEEEDDVADVAGDEALGPDDGLEETEEEEEEATEEIPAAVVDVPDAPKSGLWEALRHDDNYFGWDFGMQSDVGYADFRFSEATLSKETFNDYRGQAWITPTFEHRFGKKKKAYIRGSVEFVAWLREEVEKYQINVFDAFAAVGVDDIFSLSVGRVTTNRVIQPGNGFDIFTLEDTGALKTPNYQAGNFYAKRYELDSIWLRDTPGRAVLRLQPLKKILPDEWNDLELEATGEYGKVNLSNVFGARGSVIYDNQWGKLAGGIEHREFRRSWGEFESPGVICENCYFAYENGHGGHVSLRPPYIEGGLNYADSHAVNKGSNGNLGDAGITDRTTKGGFIELHTGHLLASTKNGPRPAWHADQRGENIRRLRIGFGQKRTEFVKGNGDFEIHVQRAGYLKYNLGFNRAYLKLVVSEAEGFGYNLVSADGPSQYLFQHADMLAARLRFAYFF